MRSTLLSDREKRCLPRAWSRREARLDKKMQNRKAYLKRRVKELEDRVEKNAACMSRLRSHMLGRVSKLLVPEDGNEGAPGVEDASATEEQTPSKDKQGAAFEVDYSAGHVKYLPEGLHMVNMDVKYGGIQKAIRDSVMTENCLGPGSAKMYLNGGRWSTNLDAELTTRVVDCKLKVGNTQSMSFKASDPPPFYDWDAPAKNTEMEKTDGKTFVKERYVGKANGMKQVLRERGFYVEGTSKTAKDARINIGEIQGNLPDFKNERTALQHTVESRGHILVLSPKFHPEVAEVMVEFSWGMSKLKFRREINDEVPKNLRKNIVVSMGRQTILTLQRVRRFARRIRDYCRGYLKLEKDGEATGCKDKIEKMRKTCKAHRNIIDMEPGFLDAQ